MVRNRSIQLFCLYDLQALSVCGNSLRINHCHWICDNVLSWNVSAILHLQMCYSSCTWKKEPWQKVFRAIYCTNFPETNCKFAQQLNYHLHLAAKQWFCFPTPLFCCSKETRCWKIQFSCIGTDTSSYIIIWIKSIRWLTYWPYTFSFLSITCSQAWTYLRMPHTSLVAVQVLPCVVLVWNP